MTPRAKSFGKLRNLVFLMLVNDETYLLLDVYLQSTARHWSSSLDMPQANHII